MGYFQNDDGLTVGDFPFDIFGDAIDKIVAAYQKDVGRQPTYKEVLACLNFVLLARKDVAMDATPMADSNQALLKYPLVIWREEFELANLYPPDIESMKSMVKFYFDQADFLVSKREKRLAKALKMALTWIERQIYFMQRS